jgi:hypothetical protein
MRFFLSILTIVAVLSLPTVAEARCRPVARMVAAPVKLVVAVKPVRRVAVLPVKVLLRRCCR